MNMRTLLECYKILEEYPNGMTKDQFYRVARINKQHAKYLLDSGLVPCINTGKKTRKYHIATHDVITYLCDREDNPEKYKVPMGFYIGKNGCSKRHPDKPATEIIRFNFRGTLTIPRLAVVEFMSGDRATAIVRKSSKHLDLLRTYAQDCHEGAMTITY